MTRYLARRLLQAIPLLVAITLVVFVLLRKSPGGPLSLYAGDPTVTAEDLSRLRQQMGLDQPPPVQYAHWLANLLQGDWGWSLVTKRPVLEMIGERLPNTLLLMSCAFAVALALALPVAVLAATRQYSLFDHLATTLAFVGNSLPTFWIGLMLIMIFAVGLHWFPAGGMYTLGEPFSVADRLHYLVLPVLTLALFDATHYTRYLRSSLLDVVRQDYIRTAYAKGARERDVVRRHAFKNAAIPLVTVIGLDMGALLGGAVVTEQIFAWPGVGLEVIIAINGRDFPVVQAAVFVVAVSFVLINLIVDLLYTWLDPRVRLA
jgi:peptide/nickel transport system permease protein